MKRNIKPFAVEFKGKRKPVADLRSLEFTSQFMQEPTTSFGHAFSEALRGSSVFQNANSYFKTEPEPAPEPVQAASSEQPWMDDLLPPREQQPETPTSGRILKALDEVDPLQERLAKAARRGRPPSTQNALVVIQPARPRGRPRKTPEVRQEPPPQRILLPVLYDPTPRVVPLKNVTSDAGRNIREKWTTRTKLAPGERWKKRLPKVCW